MEETICSIRKMQMTLCNTAKSLLGILNRNTQQSDEGERKSKKQHQQTDSSDEADQYKYVTVSLIGTY